LKVGLTTAELKKFAVDGPEIIKVSTRDLPHVVARKLDGATTVASTMRIAAMAGIHVFATGGIGGVHRGAERSFDISADMMEFAESNVAVVTAGAKAILDLALTLETLETLGVPVVGYGTDDFPAFYSRQSGHAVPMRCDTAQEVANLMRSKWSIGLKGGIVVANPIPQSSEIIASEIAPVIEKAVAEAARQNISGKNVTPFLLAKLAEVTGGRSLKANLALVKHNAAVAAEIAKAYAVARNN
jgi:pseudouridine-5'-phosphate glycosidase